MMILCHPLPTRFTWFRNGVFVACNCVFTSSNTTYHVFSHLLLHLSSFELFNRYREKKGGSQNLLSISLFVFWFSNSGFFSSFLVETEFSVLVQIIWVEENKGTKEIFSTLLRTEVSKKVLEGPVLLIRLIKAMKQLQPNNFTSDTLWTS